MSYFSELRQKACDLRTHPRGTILQYEHQEMCRRILKKKEITQEEYDAIVSMGGGEVVKI